MIVGTAGHIDHGKSALVRRLTGVDPDRLKEEKARGVSIDLGFAYLPRPDGATLGFVDVPGHERFVRHMLAGASAIDFVLLVVAADDGPMPQTREHLAILDMLGVSRGLVVMTKSDLADAERRATVEAEISELTRGAALEGADVLPFSSITGEGEGELLERLDAERARFIRPAQTGRFRLAIDRCFTLTGAGVVVTGAVRDGVVRVGDQIVVSPSGITARVRGIHAQNRPAEEGRPGERCALNLAGPGVSKEAIRRGDVALDPHLHAPTDRIDVELRVLASEPKALAAWAPLRLHCGSAELAARLVPIEGDAIRPGEMARAQLVLEKPIAAVALDRFVLRDGAGGRTIAGGRILDLRAPARKRRSPERRAQLDALAISDHGEALRALMAVPPHAVELDAFFRDRNVAPDAQGAIVARLGLVRLARGTAALSAATWAAFGQAIAAALALHHAENPDLQGIGAERLRLSIEPVLPGRVFLAGLATLQKSGAIAVEGAWIRLPGHEARLAEGDEALWADIAPRLGGETRFRPPRVRDLATETGEDEADVRRVLKLLGRLGRVDEIAHDHFFLREVTAEMVATAEDAALADPGAVVTAARFRDRLDNGRKVAIQILEFFDRHGVTIRRGDERRMNKARRNLFRRADVTAGIGAEEDA
ncbi:selenocysteine-specific translation elongation factor [Hansschlegelia quercus]|uniref:Selenocysteine-specific elongation factor n=1 Tax=Hansschlegelia quercus TaxID=2528245 RepID=A0A4V2JDB8_9HYPH|nr:selenocysteine-specific translation elongation factor [Hansschlegelia quercus]TBN48002.1 selenocysteine-specific translation elongation factor [Hansschlegelia quercus]